jgi:amino acid adenylation domain-containing protein
MGLESIVIAAATAHPGTIAVKSSSSVLTYADLDLLANRLARGLLQLGAKAGDRIGLWLEKSPEAVVAMQAALRIGAAYVPVDPLSPARRAAELLRDCGVHVVVTSAARVATLAAEGLTVATITTTPDDPSGRGLTWREVEGLSAAPLPPPMRADDDLAYILYTSGSTGRPKGVCISHRNALAFIEWSKAHVGPSPGDRFASHASFHFDLSVFDLYTSFLSGGTTCILPEGAAYSPGALVEFVQQEKISVWYSVPTALVMMMEHGGLLDIDHPSMHTVIFAGEPFPIKHLRRLRERWPEVRLFNFYGPTETNVCTAYEVGAIDPQRAHPVPIGKASCGDRVWAINQDGSEVKPGEEGELIVNGPTVMLGYWGSEPQRGPYPTGDIVRLLDDGNYEYVGRRDGMVKIRGFRVELGDVEAALLTHPELAAVGVVVAGSGIAAKLVAFAVARGATRPTLLQLKRYCVDRLPRYMILDDVRYLDALPRTANGKIDRIELAKRASAPRATA